LSGVGCRVLTVDYRVSLPVVVVGFWLSGVRIGGCNWFLGVGFRCR
jgi:hypothetical protein